MISINIGVLEHWFAISSVNNLFFQLKAFDSEGRAELWPRLLHSANSSQLAVWLDGLLPRGNHSRFMLELQAVGGAYPLSRVDVRQSIDDEFTPSIFKVIIKTDFSSFFSL